MYLHSHGTNPTKLMTCETTSKLHEVGNVGTAGVGKVNFGWTS